MKLIKCPKCGEMYSDSYRTCPFCQEDEALKGRAAAPRRKVTRRRRAPSILGPAMVLVVVLAAVLVGVLLFGGKGNAEKPDDPAVVEPDPAPATPLTLDQTTLNLNQAETAALTVTGAEDVLYDGKEHTVTLVVYGSNRNIYGPHHFKNEYEPLSVSPWTFDLTGAWKDNYESDFYRENYSFVKFSII